MCTESKPKPPFVLRSKRKIHNHCMTNNYNDWIYKCYQVCAKYHFDVVQIQLHIHTLSPSNPDWVTSGARLPRGMAKGENYGVGVAHRDLALVENASQTCGASFARLGRDPSRNTRNLALSFYIINREQLVY